MADETGGPEDPVTECWPCYCMRSVSLEPAFACCEPKLCWSVVASWAGRAGRGRAESRVAPLIMAVLGHVVETGGLQCIGC